MRAGVAACCYSRRGRRQVIVCAQPRSLAEEVEGA